MNRLVKKIIGYSIAVIILAIIISKIDLALLKSVILQTNIFWLLVLLAIRFIGFIMGTLNIWILFKAIGEIPFKKLWKYEVIRFVGSTFIPFSASAAPMIYFLKKDEKVSIEESISILMVNKILSFILVIVVLFIGILRYFQTEQGMQIMGAIAGIILGIYLTFYVNWVETLVTKMTKRGGAFLNRVRRIYRKLWEDHKILLGKNLGITAIAFFLNAAMLMVVFFAIQHPISFIDAFLISNIIQISAVFQLTPGGLGIREGLGIYLCLLIGVPLTISTVAFGILLIMKYLLAFIFTVKYGVKGLRK